ncbi:UDP-glycosyltransferase 83A1 [Sesamum alatum]|uniref:UDP-glycosyltransferase 83A1 n=1 Tax=Sesamum alatum TaxID=300844 RepID=A0AAE2CWU0_9LAMI|nr:UDP-glycosyltransferase 83A1 [Sesamum alatum]
MGKRPHVLAVPFPAQGHVGPLMKLCRLIANHGIKVTFVNTQHIHNRILAASLMLSDHDMDDKEEDNMVLTSIPDGLAPDDDRNDYFKLVEGLRSTMTGSLTDLIDKINCSNSSDDEKVSCIVADTSVGWILEVAERVGAEPVGFSPTAAASMALTLHIRNLLERGNLDTNGNLVGSNVLRLSENIPSWRNDELPWSFHDLKVQQLLFEFGLSSEKACNQAKWLLYNTFYELESSACDMNPKLLPIGPLLYTSNCKSAGHFSSFRREDTSCLSWLNEKPIASVIYISFGTSTVFSQLQLDELALGLELSGRPFLWVVRSDLVNGLRAENSNSNSNRFLERVAGIGKIVEWAPQEKVLSHPSVACFLSHCGWNSTLEGLSRGVPFLCWPYFADQFYNQKYICEKWKIGLRIDACENGIRTRHEITTKIQLLLSDEGLKANALKLKKMAEESVDHGGSSSKNLGNFIHHLKECNKE